MRVKIKGHGIQRVISYELGSHIFAKATVAKFIPSLLRNLEGGIFVYIRRNQLNPNPKVIEGLFGP